MRDTALFRGAGFFIPFGLALALFTGAGELRAEETGRASTLLSSPVPFYHDYNLAALFPVGKSGEEVQGGQAQGQRQLRLDDCIDLALEKNPAHQKTHESLRATTGEIMAAWGEYMPTMSAYYNISQNNRTYSYVDPSGVIRAGGGISKSTYTGLNIRYTLFDRAAKYFSMKNAYYLRDQRRSQLRSSELTLVNQVRQAYFNVLRQGKLLVAAREHADQRKEQLRLAEARFSVGSVTKLDVLQAQIELQNQELIIVQYENQLLTARMDLSRIMGADLTEELSLIDEFGVEEPRFEVGGLVKEALDNHPNIQNLELSIKQQQGDLWMGRLAYLPSLSTSASYQRSEDFLTISPDDQKGRGLSFSINWNVLDAFSRFRQNRNLEAGLHNLRYDLATARLDIERNVRQSYLELLRLYQSHLALAESKRLAQSSLELEQERYRLGAASLLELRTAQVDYAQKEVDLINSVYDFHRALSDLSANVGRDMSLR
ncbi:MAG: TolC family protein [Candidatus Glassbacteria bacterium]|nr:TolC family protein [Candidatus Glassbacteria bacterium]